MPRYRAKTMGTLPDGRRIRPGEEFELAGPPGAWMELVEENPPPAPSIPDDQNDTPNEETAPAESKRRKRKGAE